MIYFLEMCFKFVCNWEIFVIMIIGVVIDFVWLWFLVSIIIVGEIDKLVIIFRFYLLMMCDVGVWIVLLVYSSSNRRWW